MKKKVLAILGFIGLLVFQLTGQTKFGIIHTSFEPQKEMPFTMTINGVDVSQSDASFEIPIGEIGFDTIRYSFFGNSTKIALLKLRQNVNYKLESNSCSSYEIKTESNSKQGMVRFFVQSGELVSFIAEVDGLSDRVVNRDMIDEYHYSPASVMCPFSVRSIDIKSMEEELLHTIPFHFLHGELIDVYYDVEADKVEMKIAGYIRSNAEYRR